MFLVFLAINSQQYFLSKSYYISSNTSSCITFLTDYLIPSIICSTRFQLSCPICINDLLWFLLSGLCIWLAFLILSLSLCLLRTLKNVYIWFNGLKFPSSRFREKRFISFSSSLSLLSSWFKSLDFCFSTQSFICSPITESLSS